MLLDLRETVRNSKPIKYTLITIICIPFVLFGVGSYFSGGVAQYAAKVNGEEISVQQLESAYGQQRRQLAQMFGGQIPEGFGDETALRQQALDGLLRQQVLRNAVVDNDFTVSDKTLATAIQSIPSFQNANGQFEKERYAAQLQASGMSVDQFEHNYREDTALTQFQAGIVETSFTLPSEREQLQNLANQVRTVDTVRYAITPLTESIEISDEEIQAHFDENADSFQFPERTKIQYIRLSNGILVENIEVTDEEASDYFEANRGNYLTPEERKASHILLQLDDDASDSDVAEKTELLQSIKSRIEAGEAFGDLAKEFSEDPGSATVGGSLGQIAPGAMVPEFEEAMFGLAEIGELSEPVRTQFGMHLITVEEIIPEKGETFEQAKDKVMGAIKREQAQREFFELQELLEQEAFDNPESLDAAAASTGLEVQESDWIDGGIDTPPELSDPRILQTALSEDVKDNGNNSEPLELGVEDIMVLRVAEYEGPRAKTLDDVKEDITTTLKNEKAGEQLDESMNTGLASLESGESITAIAESTGGEAAEAQLLDRQSTDFDRGFIDELFKLPKPDGDVPVLHTATLANGDRLLVAFKAVGVPNETATDEETESGTDEAQAEPTPAEMSGNPGLGNSEFSILLQTLQGKSDIETNEAALSGETGYGYGGGYGG